jgi:hypothetical protein
MILALVRAKLTASFLAFGFGNSQIPLGIIFMEKFPAEECFATRVGTIDHEFGLEEPRLIDGHNASSHLLDGSSTGNC